MGDYLKEFKLPPPTQSASHIFAFKYKNHNVKQNCPTRNGRNKFFQPL